VKIFIYWLDKYLNLWNKSSNYFLGFCYLMLSYGIIFCKFLFYIILTRGAHLINEYPLNLLYQINGILICSIIFLYIILNIYISRYLSNKSLEKSLYQKNNINRVLEYWLNKYLNLWSKSSNYFLGFCFFMLFFCIVMCKIGLHIILTV
jgi:hypothetical protein